MAPAPNQDMLDRPRHTIHAAEVFHSNARAIASACLEASADEVVIAVVERQSMAFLGTWIIPREEIQARVPQIGDGDWAMIFSPRTTREEVEERALQLARLAFKRWEVLRRWTSRRG